MKKYFLLPLLFIFLVSCQGDVIEPGAQLPPVWEQQIPETLLCVFDLCPGERRVLAILPVPLEMVGLTVNVEAVTQNNTSVHAGNDLEVCSQPNNSCLIVPDVEGDPGATHFGNGQITLADTVVLTVIMGEDGLWSAGPLMRFIPTGDPTATPTLTATATNTPTATNTVVATNTPTATLTPTGTLPPTATATETPFVTETPTGTVIPSVTPPPPPITLTATPFATITPGITFTPTPRKSTRVCTRVNLDVGANSDTGTPVDGTYIIRFAEDGSALAAWTAQAGWKDSMEIWFDSPLSNNPERFNDSFWVFVDFLPAGAGMNAITLIIVNGPPESPAHIGWVGPDFCNALEVEFP